MPEISRLLRPLEDEIRMCFLPSLLRKSVNDIERELLGLPCRYGGMGILDPTAESDHAHGNSLQISQPLVRLILRQEADFDPGELETSVREIRKQIDTQSEQNYKERAAKITAHASAEIKLSMKLSTEKGASSWLTCVPTFDHGTILHKGDFLDAVYVRYGWPLPDMPPNCACGAPFDVQHALDCMLGGFRTIQHNEVRDLLAQCMRESGHTVVEIEPKLQKLNGEEFKYKSANKDENARSDIKCLGFWSRMRQAFFDVKVVSPLARSYCDMPTATLLDMCEKAKSREYRERILSVEHGDFSPLVFTTAGAMGPQCQIVIRRLAERMSERQSLPRSVVSGWLRCRLSFALLRTTLLCVRGTRRKTHNSENNILLAVHASKIDF